MGGLYSSLGSEIWKGAVHEKVLDLQRSLLLLTNCNGNTALHIAARLGHLDMTELLITTCAKEQEAAEKFLLLRKRNLEENTALHEAIKNNYYDIVKLLIWEDPELASFTNNAGESPLFLAVDQAKWFFACNFFDSFDFSINPSSFVSVIQGEACLLV